MPHYLYLSIGFNIALCILVIVLRNKYMIMQSRHSIVIKDNEQKLNDLNNEHVTLKESFVVLDKKYVITIGELKAIKSQLSDALCIESQTKLTNFIEQLKSTLNDRQIELEAMEHQISILDDKLLEIELYTVDREFEFDTSDDLKTKIKEVKQQQKEMYEDASAIDIEYGNWEVKKNDWYSHEEPRLLRKTANTFFAKSPYSFLTDFNQWSSASLLLHAFDLKCEMIIKNLKYTTLSKSKSDIRKAARKIDTSFIKKNFPIPKAYFTEFKNGLFPTGGFTTVAKCELKKSKIHLYQDDRPWGDFWEKAEGEPTEVWSTGFNIQISNLYIQSKIMELKLQFEYLEQKQAEKEAIKEAKARATELSKAQKEAEAKEVELEKIIEETTAMTNDVSGHELQELMGKIEKLKEQLTEAHQQKERAISMAQQTKSGYVYVISNVGTMGNGIVKIGMTRRIDPMERVKELGDASVPFTFDVHSLIRTDDAPKLERALHAKFRNQRVNWVNNRKEFFKVPLNVVKEALDELCQEEFEFKDSVDSPDYIATLELQKHINNKKITDTHLT